jgi:hypothetical protein
MLRERKQGNFQTMGSEVSEGMALKRGAGRRSPRPALYHFNAVQSV